jgi:HEAT repeat protein
MRTPHTSWKAICAIAALVCVFLLPAGAQQAQHDSLLSNLFSSDPAVRGAAKSELLAHPDPALFPALLSALPSSQGTIRDDLLDILAKYDDPRKIPVFVALAKTGRWYDEPQLDEQLAKLGAPAARAILDGCAGEGGDYASWAATALQWMTGIGPRFMIEAVESDDNCEHAIGATGLEEFGDADVQSESQADIGLAADAVVDPDERIREAARRWFDSWKGKEDTIDFSGIVEALIAAYQANAPPATMVAIAKMLSDRERPRVTRFMRAAMDAPNSEIRGIANRYLSIYGEGDASSAEANAEPRTADEKIDYLNRLAGAPPDNVNEEITPFLADPDAGVRAAAVSALGSVNMMSTDPRDSRERDPESASPRIRNALKDSSPLVRAAAAKALGDMRSDDDLALIVAALDDPDASVAISAANAIQEIPGNSAAAPALTRVYRDAKEPPAVRKQALLALESTGDPDSIPIFLEDLRSGGNAPPFAAAMALAGALQKRPAPAAFDPIYRAFEEAQPSSPREFLIVAMAATKNPLAFDALVNISRWHDSILAPKAAGALGLLGDRRAIPVLAELLKNPDYYNVRPSAAEAFTHFSDFTVPPELVAALRDPDTEVQWLAVKALLQSHDPKAIDALIAAIPNPMAIEALGEAHDRRALPALLACLRNPANETAARANAAAALGELGNARAVDPLIAALQEDNSAITMRASYALAALKDKRAVEPLEQAYARWSTGQRENADSVRNFIVQALLQLGVTAIPKATTGTPAP